MTWRPFRLQYVSDLHIEFHDRKNTGNLPCEMFIKPIADHLALCGDIGMPERPALFTFLKWCSEHFKEVYWVPGNHEFYNVGLPKKSTYNEKLAICQELCNRFPNVHFMHRRVCELPEWKLHIAGCTMWTEIRPEDDTKAIMGMNDVRQMYINEGEHAMPDDFRRWHTEDKAWLQEQIQKAEDDGEAMIVLTHHLPSYQLINPKYDGHPLNFCFATNLEQMIRAPIRGWLCGHSHTSNDVIINGVQCALNPHGYPGEDVTTFSREKVLEITCDLRDESAYDESCFGECDE